VRSLKFFHGLLQVSSRTEAASAIEALFASYRSTRKSRDSDATKGEVIAAAVGIFSVADTSQSRTDRHMNGYLALLIG
jgi:hypothetical protein